MILFITLSNSTIWIWKIIEAVNWKLCCDMIALSAFLTTKKVTFAFTKNEGNVEVKLQGSFSKLLLQLDWFATQKILNLTVWHPIGALISCKNSYQIDKFLICTTLKTIAVEQWKEFWIFILPCCLKVGHLITLLCVCRKTFFSLKKLLIQYWAIQFCICLLEMMFNIWVQNAENISVIFFW